MLQFVNCRSNHYLISNWWSVWWQNWFITQPFLSSQELVELLHTLQYTAFSRYNSIQTCGGITACLLTTARILTASVFLSIPNCILLLESGIFLVLRVSKFVLRLPMCPSNQCLLCFFYIPTQCHFWIMISWYPFMGMSNYRPILDGHCTHSCRMY